MFLFKYFHLFDAVECPIDVFYADGNGQAQKALAAFAEGAPFNGKHACFFHQHAPHFLFRFARRANVHEEIEGAARFGDADVV